MACKSNPPPVFCSASTDCGPGLICSHGVCTGCASDSDCQPSEACSPDHRCLVPDAGASDAGDAGNSDAGDGGNPDAGQGDGGIDPATIGSTTGCTAPNVIYVEGDPRSPHPHVESYDLTRGGEWIGGGGTTYQQGVLYPSFVNTTWIFGNLSRRLQLDSTPFGSTTLTIARTGVAYHDPGRPGSTNSIVGQVGETDRTCDSTTAFSADYVFDQITLTSNKITEFRARWQYHCDYNPAAVRGCVWWKAGLQPPDAGPLPDGNHFNLGAEVPTDGGLLGSTAECASDNTFHISGDPGDLVHPGSNTITPAWGTAGWRVEPIVGGGNHYDLQWSPNKPAPGPGIPPETIEISLSNPDGGDLYQGELESGVLQPPPPLTKQSFFLDVFGNHCSSAEAAYQVQRLAHDADGGFVEVMASFVNHCQGATGVSRGCVHIKRAPVYSGPDAGAPYQWLQFFPDDRSSRLITALAAQPDGTLVAAGSGVGDPNGQSAISVPHYDFLARLTADTGSPVLWRSFRGDVDTTVVFGVGSDVSGNIRFAGRTGNRPDLDGGTPAPSTFPVFLAALDAAGKPVWEVPLPIPDSSDIGDISFSPQGNVAVAVPWQVAAPAQLDLGCGAQLNDGGTTLIASFSGADGGCQWSGRAEYNLTPKMSTGPDGSVYLLGPPNSTIDAGCGLQTSTATGSKIGLTKFGPGGSCAWSKQFVDPAASSGGLVPAHLVATSDGDVIISGDATNQTVDLGCGTTTLPLPTGGSFVARLAGNDGHCVWAQPLALAAATTLLFRDESGSFGALSPSDSSSLAQQRPVPLLAAFAPDGTVRFTYELPAGTTATAAVFSHGHWYVAGYLDGAPVDFPGRRLTGANGGTDNSPFVFSLAP